MLNRSVVASLAVVVAGTGLAWGQVPSSPTSPITTGGNPPPSVVPLTPPPAPVEPLPLPKEKPATPTPAPVAKPTEPAKDGPALAPAEPAATPPAYPTYATNLIEPCLPWTAFGRTRCGTVYLNTPYTFLDAQYGFSWIKHDRSPELVTTATTKTFNTGAIGDGDARVLFDGTRLHDEPYHGGRFAGGVWIDECQYFGVRGGFMFLGSLDQDFIAAASGLPGEPGLYRPFFNINSNFDDAFITSEGGFASGIIKINSRSRFMGGDGHAMLSIARGVSFRIDGLVGVRWLGLDEDITIEENVRPFARAAYPAPVDIGIRDHFGVRNDFVGADFGLQTHVVKGCWSFDFLGRIALGGTHQVIRVDGFTGLTDPRLTPPGQPFAIFSKDIGQGGRLTSVSNIGKFGSDTFSFVPELGFNVGWQASRCLKLKAGYSWLYWHDVVRPGDQIDTTINPIATATHPAFRTGRFEPQRPALPFRETDIWVQTLSLGMEFNY